MELTYQASKFYSGIGEDDKSPRTSHIEMLIWSSPCEKKLVMNMHDACASSC